MICGWRWSGSGSLSGGKLAIHRLVTTCSGSLWVFSLLETCDSTAKMIASNGAWLAWRRLLPRLLLALQQVLDRSSPGLLM